MIPPIVELSLKELEQFYASRKLLGGYSYRPWLLQGDDGELAKCFHDKRHLSTGTLVPKGPHFARNAVKLSRLGINGPIPKKIYRNNLEGVTIVTYDRIEGEDLRTLAAKETFVEMNRLSSYLSELHEKGVYFRGIHLGNILLMPSGELALIDIAGMTIWPFPISVWHRARNVCRLLTYADDRSAMKHYDATAFVKQYADSAGLKDSQRRIFLWLCRRWLT